MIEDFEPFSNLWETAYNFYMDNEGLNSNSIICFKKNKNNYYYKKNN